MSTLKICLFVVLVACGSSKPAEPPASKVTHAECVEAVEHATKLLAADPALASYADDMRANRDRRVAECEATATRADHECLMKAKTAQELGLCPMPGQGGAR